MISGLLAGLLGFTSPNPLAFLGVFLAMSVYLFSLLLARNIFYARMAASVRYKLVTSGLGSFITLFLFTWILYNTLLPQDAPGL